MKKIHAELLLLTIVALWGLSFSLTKPLLGKVGVFNFLTYRFLIGGLLLMLIMVVTKKFKMNKDVLKVGIKSGLLLFVAFYCHIEGLKYTTIAKNSFIVGSSVIYVPIIMFLIYKKKSSSMVLFQTVIAILGLALITLVSSENNVNYGDIITLMGSIVYGFYTIQIERNVRKYDTNVFTAIQLSTVGIISLIATFALEEITFDFTTIEWLNIAFLSVVLTGIACYLLNVIQKDLSASNVMIIFTLEPFFATIFGWVFLKEYVSRNVILGGVLILFAVVSPYISQYFMKLTNTRLRNNDESVKVN